ncbi:hypothetical protein OC846_002422 [Tilletia horrida]|uniref:Uncharacterized protein n=1 Tax=Tilletia horrida TaxID=155126 RepID=A0AAN6GSB2_9BASI|nr:hypothetical protein OC846_002422 [Tilletia horrida]
MFGSTPLLLTCVLTVFISAAAVKADYDIHNLPHKTDDARGQVGVNDCIKTYGSSNAGADCQTAVINSAAEFCLWAPRSSANIGDEEGEVVAYCTKSGFGTRLIPSGTIKGVQFRKTNSYVQVTGKCDCTKINVAPNDEGGELDPHGATGSGNPVGGLVFTNAWSNDKQNYVQIKEWSSFIGYNEFSFRACIGNNAADWCPHIYDLQNGTTPVATKKASSRTAMLITRGAILVSSMATDGRRRMSVLSPMDTSLDVPTTADRFTFVVAR